MAKFDRLMIYKTIFSEGLIPLFYNEDKKTAKYIIKSI